MVKLKMTVYYIMMITMITLATGSYIFSRNKYIKNTWWIYIVLLFLILALRHPSMGYDLRYGSAYGYLGWFRRISYTDFKELSMISSMSQFEFGYVLLNRVIGVFSHNEQVFIAVCTALSILPFSLFIKRNSDYPLLSVIILIGLSSFLLYYSALRQTVALGICVCSVKYIQEENLKKFLLCIATATAIHYSAIFFTVSYFAYHIQIGRRVRLISITFIPILFALRKFLYPILNVYSGDYVTGGEMSSGTVTFWIYYLIYVFCILLTLFCPKKYFKDGVFHIEDKRNQRITIINGYFNIYFLASCCMIFQDVNPLSARLAAYYMFVLTALIPQILHIIKDRRLFYFMYFILFVTFLFFGLNRLDEGSDSYALSSPYRFFWQ